MIFFQIRVLGIVIIFDGQYLRITFSGTDMEIFGVCLLADKYAENKKSSFISIIKR
jgi:hypothetical protein